MLAATPTYGVIVSVARVADTESYSFRPTVRYTAADGQVRTVISPITYAGFGHKPHTGDQVNVRYLAPNPDDAQLNSFETWALPLSIVLIGMMFALPFGCAFVASC